MESQVMKLFIFLCITSECLSAPQSYRSKLWEDEAKEVFKRYRHLASLNATAEEKTMFVLEGIKHVYNITNHAPLSSKPLSVQTSFDCKMREVAYIFAKKLKKESNLLKMVFDGLQLGPLCNQKFQMDLHVENLNSNQMSLQMKKKFKMYHNDENLNAREMFLRVKKNVLSLFVDNKSSKSQVVSDGSFENPYSTIEKAIKRCKSLSKSTECHIKVRKGRYFIHRSLVIDSDNIFIENFKKERVEVSSDKVISPKWKIYKNDIEEYVGWNPMYEGISPGKSKGAIKYIGKFSNSSVCKQYCYKVDICTAYAYFNKSVPKFDSLCYIRTDGFWHAVKLVGAKSGKKVLIYKADLKAENLQNVDQVFVNGRRAIRARFPNANPETMGLHTIPSGYIPGAEKWLPPIKHNKPLMVQIKDPSRKGSLYPTFYYGIGGAVSQFDPPESFWAATYMLPSGLQYGEDLEINMREWSNPATGIIHSLRGRHWGNWMFKIDSRDKKSRQIKWTWGGFQEAQGTNVGAEWYVENILEELDCANEWFYDEKAKVIYYSPNVTEKDLPQKISIPQLESLMKIIGSQRNPRKNVNVNGIKFAHTIQTFLKPYFVPSGGDWTTHRGGALFIEGTENVTIGNCEFDSPGGNVIFISKYNRGTIIQNNLIYRAGDSGIVAVGEAELIDGTNQNQPRGLKILDNLIFDFGIWGKQTYAFVQSKSCESLIERNIFFNGPRGGINMNDGFGGGNTINWNLLFNFLRESNDHGPINTWDRVPYITKVADGKTASLDVKENQIHRNFIIDNYRSDWPIDHDDGSCFWNDTYNFMVYGGFKNYLGHDKHSLQNVYVYPSTNGHYCLDTRGQTLGTSGYGDVWMGNKCVNGNSNLFLLGSCSVDDLRETIPLLAYNKYYTKDSSVIYHCGSNVFNLETFKRIGMDIGSTQSPLPTDDIVLSWAKEIFSL